MFAPAEPGLRTGPRAVPCLPSLAVWAAAPPLGVGCDTPLAAVTVVLVAVLALVRADDADGRIGWRASRGRARRRPRRARIRRRSGRPGRRRTVLPA
ncbi:hypothetical protein [Actinomadura pelletieri]|uniref:hypothetical protein n=1 Tax=Actinomadura pelletieri TaxID=111805 RepID=UPI0011C3DF3F|nr:hypothetical protein [Actinomadura pelletieri]